MLGHVGADHDDGVIIYHPRPRKYTSQGLSCPGLAPPPTSGLDAGPSGPCGGLQTQLSSISLLGASRKIWGVSPFHGVTGGPTPGVLSLLSLAWAASPGEVYVPQASLATERARSVQPKSSIYRPGQKPRSQKPSATTPTSAHIPHRPPPWKRPEAVEAVSD